MTGVKDQLKANLATAEQLRSNTRTETFLAAVCAGTTAVNSILAEQFLSHPDGMRLVAGIGFTVGAFLSGATTAIMGIEAVNDHSEAVALEAGVNQYNLLINPSPEPHS
jgi:hypothetical protein